MQLSPSRTGSAPFFLETWAFNKLSINLKFNTLRAVSGYSLLLALLRQKTELQPLALVPHKDSDAFLDSEFKSGSGHRHILSNATRLWCLQGKNSGCCSSGSILLKMV